MIELAKHIEVLLLENDCVIVPGLGGFIAHYRSSLYNKETRIFCPPLRSIGFNPKLVMNDGLLVQSYMQAYNTDFPDATRKIGKVVDTLKEKLYQEGHVCLNQVGTLYYNMNGNYEFEPTENGFFTPSLYGLEAFTPQRLAFQPILKPVTAKEEVMPHTQPSKRKPMSAKRWMQHVAAIAAAILLFFVCSVPVKNTYIDEASYASLGSEGLFEAIRNQSAASIVISPTPQQTQQQTTRQQQTTKKLPKNNINTLKPVAVKTEKVEAPIEKESPAKTTKAPETTQPAATSVKAKGGNNHVIVASLTSQEDADKVVKSLKQKGYAGAQVLVSQGRYRVSLCNYARKTDAYQKVQEIKQQPDFASAWVFTSK